MNPSRFIFVDGLRAIAATSVVVFHIVEGRHVDALLSQVPSITRWFLEQGYLGVWIFFVLSGFVIAHSLHEKRLGAREFLAFTVKRSLRLDPPYYATIGVTIIYSIVATHFVNGKAAPEYSLPQILSHFFYLQDILGYKAISPIFWTLCLEIQFYLLYAVLVKFGHRLFLACLFFSLLWPLGIAPTATGWFFNYWYAFLVGVASYKAWKNKDERSVFFIFTAILFIQSFAFSDERTFVAAVIALILFQSAITSRIYTMLATKPMQWVGKVSYSLYLTHSVATGAAFRLVDKFAIANPVFAELTGIGLTILCCLSAAALFYHLVERPSIFLSRKLTETREMPRKYHGVTTYE